MKIEIEKLAAESPEAFAARVRETVQQADEAEKQAAVEAKREKDAQEMRRFLERMAEEISKVECSSPKGIELKERLQLWAACVRAGGLHAIFGEIILGYGSKRWWEQ